jgi:glycosyltransferase involved in cell wall biosynthesis
VTAPVVSVVVPTYQRSELLIGCVTSFDNQNDPPPFELVVVDDGSTDDTQAVLRGMAEARPWLTWSSQAANRGPAAARNTAVAKATGELLLFLDDDVSASPDLLRQHVQLHAAADDTSLAVLGRVDWHPSLEVTPFMRWLDRSGLQFAYDTWLREGPVEVPAAAFYTANLSMRRELVLDAGGFDERFPFPAYEDLELATRLTARGLRMDYRPVALAYHRRPIDLATFKRRMTMVGESAQLMRAIAPDFPLDDMLLRRRRVGTDARVWARVKAAVRRDDASRSDHYWATIAAAYATGMKRGDAKLAQTG